MKNTKIIASALFSFIISLSCLAGDPKKDTSHNNKMNSTLTAQRLTASIETPMKSESPKAEYVDAGKNDDNVVITYRIQILALDKPINVDKIEVNGLKADVFMEVTKKVTRYYVGEVHDLLSAFDVRDEIQSDGFKDAIIVAFKNGERISIKESLPLLGDN